MPRTFELVLRVNEDGAYKQALEYKSDEDLVELFGKLPCELSSAFTEMVGTLRELVAKETVGSKVERAVEMMQRAVDRMAERVPPPPPPPPPAPDVANFQPTPPQTEEAPQ